MDEEKKNHLSYLHFCLYLNFVCLWVKSVLVNVCGRDCQCDGLKRRWCSAVRSCLPDTCSDCACLSLWVVSAGCPWPVGLKVAGGRVREWGRGVRRVCEQDDNSASLAWGAVLTLSPSLRPLSYPSVAFKHSYAQGMHKHAKTDARILLKKHLLTHTHTQTHTYIHFHSLSRLRWASCYLNAIRLLPDRPADPYSPQPHS